jgi:hypothetical protein
VRARYDDLAANKVTSMRLRTGADAPGRGISVRASGPVPSKPSALRAISDHPALASRYDDLQANKVRTYSQR